MAKAFRVVSAGLAAVVLASLVACSQAPESGKSSSAPADGQATADQGTAADDTANSADVEKSRVVEGITPPAPAADPMATVFQLRKFSGETVGSEQLRLNYPTPDKAVVTLTVRGLKDDSVKATRTRYEFQPAAGASAGQQMWQLARVTEQNICQANRGPQDWSGEVCK